MALIVDIKDALVGFVEAATMSVQPATPWHQRSGDAPIRLQMTDDRFHRMFEVSYALDAQPLQQAGTDIRVDLRATIGLELGYLGQRTDLVLTDMIAADNEDLIAWLLGYARIWPAGFMGINIGKATPRTLTGDGREAVLVQWPMIVNYQVPTT